MTGIGDHIRSLPGSGINQTSFLFGAILFAFLFFITVRGDLAKWLGLLGLANTSGSAASVGNTVTPSLSATPSLNAQLPNIGAIGLPGLGSGAGGVT